MTRIATEGGHLQSGAYVKYYFVDVGNNTEKLHTIRETDGSRRVKFINFYSNLLSKLSYLFSFQIFFGNYNRALMTQNAFRPHVIAQYLKLTGKEVYGGFALRLEVFGCNYTEIAVEEDTFVKSLGLSSLHILHSQIFGDEFPGHGTVDEIRLGCDPYFFFTGVYMSISGFWQFDLGIRYNLVKFVAEGRNDVNEYMEYLTLIQYTDDIIEWFEDKSVDNEIRKYFVASSNKKVDVKFKDIIVARHIRFKTGVSILQKSQIKMVLYGFPASHSILYKTNKFPKEITASSEKEPASSASQALINSNTFWCKLNTDINSWWWADFGVIYYISKISIYYKENSWRDACKDIHIQGSQFNKTNMTDQVLIEIRVELKKF